MSESDSESSQNDSDEDSTSDEEFDYGQILQSSRPKLSSWDCILHSIENLRNSGQDIDFETIFNAAKQAILCGDFRSGLKLLAEAVGVAGHPLCYTRSTSAEDGDTTPRERILLENVREIMCNAITLCASFHGASKLHNDNLLKLAINKVVSYFEMLGIADVMLLSNTSAFYLSIKDYNVALEFGSKAISLDPTSITAQEVYENICCHLVERWHFVMLNDKKRNSAYEQALLKTLDGYENVARICDVGCGTGLLSMIAAKHLNCAQVFAVEKSSVMAETAKKVFEMNNNLIKGGKIQLINKMSTEMSVPEDIPCYADILVTETFDAGLFGEGIVPTLCHAWSTILKKETSQIIPGSATLFVQAVECDGILNESRLRQTSALFGLSQEGIHVCSSVSMCKGDPYTTCDLKRIPSGFRPLTESVVSMTVDFNNLEELLRLKENMMRQFTLEVKKEGRVDALIVWFQLNCLSSPIEGEIISTHYDCDSCWEQAVFPVHPFRLQSDYQDVAVQPGDKLRVNQMVKGAQHCMTVTAIDRIGVPQEQAGPVDELSKATKATQHARTELPIFLASWQEWSRQNVYCLNSGDIATLNDEALNASLSAVLHQSLLKAAAGTLTNFVHLSNGFSPLCLQALKLGYHHAWTCINSAAQRSLLVRLAKDNEIDRSRLTILDNCVEDDDDSSDDVTNEIDDSEDGDIKDSILDGDWSSVEEGGISKTPPTDVQRCVVLLDVVDRQGRMVENLNDHIMHIKEFVGESEEVCVIPHKVDVFAVLVDSEELLSRSRVLSDEHTLGFNIGAFINQFSTRNHQGIQLETLQHTKLCEPFKMFSIDLKTLMEDSETADSNIQRETEDDSTSELHRHQSTGTSFDRATGKGSPGAAVEKSAEPAADHNRQTKRYKNLHAVTEGGLEQRRNFIVTATAPGTVTALVYWFQLHLSDSVIDDKTTILEDSTHTCINPGSLKPNPLSSKEDVSTISVESKTTICDAVTQPSSFSTASSKSSLSLYCESSNNPSTSGHPDSEELSHKSSNDNILISNPEISYFCPPSSSTSPTLTLGSPYSSRITTTSSPQILTDLVTAGKDIQQPISVDHSSSPASVLTSESSSNVVNSSSRISNTKSFINHISSSNPTAPVKVINTLDPSHHWQQAAVMTQPGKPPSSVVPGDKIQLQCTMGSSAFNFVMTKLQQGLDKE